MRQALLAIISLVVCLASSAQDSTSVTTDGPFPEPDTSAVLTADQALESDTLATVPRRRAFVPRLYWDYGKTLMLWNPESSKTEVGIEFLIADRIQLIGEFGLTRYTPSEVYKNVEYTSEGTFWRAGIGYLGYIDQLNRIGIGARYAQADFQDSGIVTIRSESGFNDDYQELHERTDLSAKWIELAIDSERQLGLKKSDPESILNRLISMGIMIRYRILLDAPTFEPVDVFAIPGYGRRQNVRVFALNLFLKVNF